MSGEMMTALFASFAQAESDSISGNMRWSYQKRMQNGTFNTCRAPYGYRLENNTLVICEDEAKIVRYIFNQYLSGKHSREIAVSLTESGPDGKKWSHRAVEYILQNERYAGNALLQKRYTTETLPRRQPRNKGELPMYYVEGSNEAIITQDTFDRAQRLRESRVSKHMSERNPQLLSGAVCCGNCGKVLRPKHINGKVYMVCRIHEEDLTQCPIAEISESEITEAFLRLYYKLRSHSECILGKMLTALQTIRSRRMLWSLDVIELNKKISELTSQNQLLASLKQQGLVDPDIFISQTNVLTEQLRSVKLEKERLLDTEQDNAIAPTRELMDILKEGPEFLPDFDTELFGELVDKIIVDSNDRLRFRLKNGLELPEPIERTVR